MAKKKSQSPTPKEDSDSTGDGMPFPEAIKLLMGGKKITRIEWDSDDEYGLLRDSFLMIHRKKNFHTWIVSEGDMLAIDWIVLK